MDTLHFHQSNDRASDAFSLVELLAVIAIGLILMVAVAPALNSTSKSAELGMAAQMLVDEIHLCRSQAAGFNRPVEICFLRSPGQNSTWFEEFRSRSLEQDGNYRWMSRTKKLPEPIAIASDSNLSNVLGSQSALPNAQGREEISLRFSPSGEMELVSPTAPLGNSERFITLGYKTDFLRSQSTLPVNFVTIQIDSRNSRAAMLRP